MPQRIETLLRAVAALPVVCFLGCSSESPAAGGEKPDAAVTADAASDAGQAEAATPALDPTGFAPTGSLAQARSAHTATLLTDGRVLVVGGESVVTRAAVDSVEIYDPSTGQWSNVASLPEPRSNHIAMRLGDGRVLVAGGGISAPIGVPSGNDVLASALLFDPSTETWTPTGSMLEGRSHFGASLLPSGNVLLVGGGAGTHDHGSTCNGFGVTNCGPIGDTLARAEIFDVKSGSFSKTAALSEARYSFTSTALDSGRVLIAGGADDYKVSFKTTEIYDEPLGTWSAGPDFAGLDRLFHSAASLPSGRVLVAGGKKSNTAMLASADILDIAAGTAVATAPLAIPHTAGVTLTLQSGRVLSVGGFRCPNPCEPIALAEIYDESSGAWTQIGELESKRAGHTATRLLDGRVLVTGGYGPLADLATSELSQ